MLRPIENVSVANKTLMRPSCNRKRERSQRRLKQTTHWPSQRRPVSYVEKCSTKVKAETAARVLPIANEIKKILQTLAKKRNIDIVLTIQSACCNLPHPSKSGPGFPGLRWTEGLHCRLDTCKIPTVGPATCSTKPHLGCKRKLIPGTALSGG